MYGILQGEYNKLHPGKLWYQTENSIFIIYLIQSD
jgi:hypothetical protein